MSDTDFTAVPTGAGLMGFIDFTIAKGYVKRTTGQAMKTAVKEILSATQGDDGWEAFDLTSFDEDDLLRRFETLRAMKFSGGSLTTYKRRFSNAVSMFEEFRSDPANWRPAIQQRNRGKADKSASTPPQTGSGSPGRTRSTEPAKPPQASRPTAGPLITYPFPLRPGTLVSIELPPDLTHGEAQRLAAFVESLAIEDPQPPARQERTPGDE